MALSLLLVIPEKHGIASFASASPAKRAGSAARLP